MPRIVQLDDLTPAERPRRGALPTVKESLPPGLAAFLESLARLSIWLLVFALIYDSYVVSSGSLVQGEVQRLQYNLTISGQIVVVTGLYLVFYTFVSAYELRDRFFGLLGIFALVHFGLPFLFINVLHLYGNLMAHIMKMYLDYVAQAALVAVAIRFLCAVMAFMKQGLKGARAAIASEGNKVSESKSRVYSRPFYRVISRCWELSYCRDYLLQVCPAWHKKKSCWKYGSGCMCDMSMMDQLIKIEMTPAAGRAIQMAAPSVPRGPAKCRTCSIYLAHEEQKYRVISPLIPLGGLALLVFGWNYILAYYTFVAVFLGRLVGQLAVGPAVLVSSEWTQTLLDPIVQYSLICCSTLILVSYGLRFIEWLILDKKL